MKFSKVLGAVLGIFIRQRRDECGSVASGSTESHALVSDPVAAGKVAVDSSLFVWRIETRCKWAAAGTLRIRCGSLRHSGSVHSLGLPGSESGTANRAESTQCHKSCRYDPTRRSLHPLPSTYLPLSMP